MQELSESGKYPVINPNACKTCNGNGVIATDNDIVTCPRCHGTKIEPPEGQTDAIRK